jgi:hypothetical protein
MIGLIGGGQNPTESKRDRRFALVVNFRSELDLEMAGFQEPSTE